MTEPRELSYLVPVEVLAEVNTAVTVLESYGPAVTQALRQLDRATTVAWKAVNLAEVTDNEWQLVKQAIGIDRGWEAPTGWSPPWTCRGRSSPPTQRPEGPTPWSTPVGHQDANVYGRSPVRRGRRAGAA
jgi:hypothetical protein